MCEITEEKKKRRKEEKRRKTQTLLYEKKNNNKNLYKNCINSGTFEHDENIEAILLYKYKYR